MKKIIILILASLVNTAECKTVSVQVIDDLGKPIQGANVSVWFWSPHASFSDEKKYKSDANGRVIAQGETIVGYDINVLKKGYYSAKSEPYISAAELVERAYILPRILNPVPLYAIFEFHLKFPAQEKWLGYDFVANDWIAPHGKGNVADIRFKFKNQFKGYRDSIENLEEEKAFSRRAYAVRKEEWTEEKYKIDAGKWDGVLEISFPNAKEGILEEGKQFLPYSELKLPHLAPEEGYEPMRHYEASTYKGRPPERQVGFFLRTRVMLDADGNIISANYAKIYGDIRFDARGTVSFGYYYNPTPNDRNLEFARNRNLLRLPSLQLNPSNP